MDELGDISSSPEQQLPGLVPLADNDPVKFEVNKQALSEVQEVLARPDNRDVAAWYLQEVGRCGELRVEDGDLSDVDDPEGWAEVRDGDKLGGIDARAFKIRRKVLQFEGREAFAQPFVENGGKPFTFVDKDGQEKTIILSGIVAGLSSRPEGEDARYLVSVRQEAGSRLPKRAKVAAPIQGSLYKFDQIDQGNSKIDPTLAVVATFVQEEFGLSLMDALRQRKIDWKILPGADDNRINAYNITFALDVDPAKMVGLTDGGKNKWVTGREVGELGEAGLLNGHFTDMTAKTRLVH